MLTPGALRQRRRRALESAEERRERLARDAERKRMKRLSESAEEAAWRRTVDALRKKEKRMKERETKMAADGTADCAGNGTADQIQNETEFHRDVDSFLRDVRHPPKKRRSRHVPGTGECLISFPSTMGDTVEFGGNYLPSSLLCDSVGCIAGMSVPSTSKTSYNVGSRCPVNGEAVPSRLRCVSAGAWGSDLVGAVMGSAHPFGALAAHSNQSTKGHHIPTRLDKEDCLDCCHDDSLEVLSPEVIISEVKPEPLEDDNEQLVSENRSLRGRSAVLSALSPEVIIREVMPCIPRHDFASGRNSRRELTVDEEPTHQLRYRGEYLRAGV